MYYVTMTDKFLSGWGSATNKISKVVCECDTLSVAKKVRFYAKQRGEMKNIRIRTTKPRYLLDTHHTIYLNKKDNPVWYSDFPNWAKERYNDS